MRIRHAVDLRAVEARRTPNKKTECWNISPICFYSFERRGLQKAFLWFRFALLFIFTTLWTAIPLTLSRYVQSNPLRLTPHCCTLQNNDNTKTTTKRCFLRFPPFHRLGTKIKKNPNSHFFLWRHGDGILESSSEPLKFGYKKRRRRRGEGNEGRNNNDFVVRWEAVIIIRLPLFCFRRQ